MLRNSGSSISPYDRDQVSFICKVCGKHHDIENESPDYENTCIDCAIEQNTDECYECGEWFYSPVEIKNDWKSCCPKCNEAKENK